MADYGIIMAGLYYAGRVPKNYRAYCSYFYGVGDCNLARPFSQPEADRCKPVIRPVDSVISAITDVSITSTGSNVCVSRYKSKHWFNSITDSSYELEAGLRSVN